MTIFERKIAIVGIGLAAITAALFYVQLNEMTKQTQILASQSEGTNAGALIDEMNTRKQLGIVQEQADAAQKQAKAAQNSAEAIKMQMRTQQRAWLQVTSTTPRIPDNGPINIQIKIDNIGNTPATHIHGYVVVTVHKRDELPKFVYTAGHARYRIGTGAIFPHKPIELPYEAIRHGEKGPEVIIFDSTLKQTLADRKAYIVAHGYIRYADVFQQQHRVTFCNIIVTDPNPYDTTDAYKKCVAHNGVDPN